VLDLLRFDRFTGGAYWAGELGSPRDPASLAVLLEQSPYHNIRPGTCYPATLVMSGDLDQTAVPAHAYKYVAALQHAQPCERPVLLKVMRGAGHNFGASPEAIADSYTDALEFLDRVLGSGGPAMLTRP
jgi:prolyl oligopeptidase